MRFDNAFLTVNGKVGMQFVEKGIFFSVYKDKHDTLHVSEHASKEQKGSVIAAYMRREKHYTPKHRTRMGSC